MKIRINNKYFRWGLTAFLVIAAGIVFYYFMFHSANIKAGVQTITGILMPVVVGMAIAYLLTPIINFLEKRIFIPLCIKFKIKDSTRRKSILRVVSILVTAFLFVALIYLLIAMLISQIVPSVENIINNFDNYTSNFTIWVNRTMNDYPEISSFLIKKVNNYSNEFENWVSDMLPNTASLVKTVSMSVIGVFGALWNFVIGFVISIYMLASKEKFAGQAKKITYAIFEQDMANMIIRNFRFTHKTFIDYLSGKVVDSIIIGLICFIGTTLMKTPYATLVSVIIGVTNVIPFFGPFLGAIPSTILIFVVDPMHPLNCVYFVIFVLVLQQFDGNILGPKIIGSSTGLKGFWVIFSITLFGGLFGVPGMVIGVPIFAVIYAGIKSCVNAVLVKKSMPVEADLYEKLDYIDEEGFHALPVPEIKKEKKKNKKSEEQDSDQIGK